MFRILINKLKTKKKQLQSFTINNNINAEFEKESDSKITISSENNIYKIEISD